MDKVDLIDHRIDSSEGDIRGKVNEIALQFAERVEDRLMLMKMRRSIDYRIEPVCKRKDS